MFQTKVVEKIKTHILCSVTFFENLALYEIMRKYIEQEATDDYTAHALCMLHTRTLTICNTHCFSNTQTVARTRLFVMLYVHWLLV